MDCKTARLIQELTVGRPAELDPSEAGALEAHLDDCPACRLSGEQERAFDLQVRTAMADVPIAPHFQKQLLMRTLQKPRVRRRRLLLAVAASLGLIFLSAGSAWSWLTTNRRPDIDPSALVEEWAAVRGDNPERLLSVDGIRTVVPRDLDLALLESCFIREFKGRRVPELLFQHGNFTAHVLILDDSQFNLDDRKHGARADSGGYSVELRRFPNDVHHALLIMYTGPDADWLFAEAQATTA
jgi:hypothetical protein